jgi:hypothetical protein
LEVDERREDFEKKKSKLMEILEDPEVKELLVKKMAGVS